MPLPSIPIGTLFPNHIPGLAILTNFGLDLAWGDVLTLFGVFVVSGVIVGLAFEGGRIRRIRQEYRHVRRRGGDLRKKGGGHP